MVLAGSQDTGSTHKNLLYFDLLAMNTWKQIKNTISYTTASRIKYLGANQNKYGTCVQENT